MLARVHGSFGAKRSAVTPLVMPCCTAQSTASWQKLPSFTSVKGLASFCTVGEPAAR